MAVGRRSTIARLTELLRNATYRTNHGEFLWRSVWDETLVMQHIALDLLRSLQRNNNSRCYLILDDTPTFFASSFLTYSHEPNGIVTPRIHKHALKIV